MSASKGKVQQQDLFEKEHKIIEHARKIIAQSTETVDLQEYETILKSFNLTLNQMAKIIKIHDRQQHEISKLNDKLARVSTQTARYIPAQVFRSIFSNDKESIIESQRRRMTIFFSDIVNFSELAQDLDQQTLVTMMNTYLNEMFNIAKKYGGTIDKTIGDAMLIFFGAPDTMGEKEDALACVKMAIDMRNTIVNLDKLFLTYGISNSLKVRMAIDTGYCTVGNFGNQDRMDYTAIGNPVNLASRLQNIAGYNEILITHQIYSLIKNDVYCEKKESALVKGFRYPIMCYEVNDLLENIKRKTDITEFFDGFSLHLNRSKIGPKDAEDIIVLLHKLIAMLEKDQSEKPDKNN